LCNKLKNRRKMRREMWMAKSILANGIEALSSLFWSGLNGRDLDEPTLTEADKDELAMGLKKSVNRGSFEDAEEIFSRVRGLYSKEDFSDE
jgi:hypothetical protein